MARFAHCIDRRRQQITLCCAAVYLGVVFCEILELREDRFLVLLGEVISFDQVSREAIRSTADAQMSSVISSVNTFSKARTMVLMK